MKRYCLVDFRKGEKVKCTNDKSLICKVCIIEKISKIFSKQEKDDSNDSSRNFDNEFNCSRCLIFISIVIILSIFALLYLSDGPFIKNDLYKYICSFIFTILYLLVLIYLKQSLFSKILFRYKSKMMYKYYNMINNINYYTNRDNERRNEIQIIIIPKTYNGELIGILESLLYAIGVFLQSYALIGIVLAIRSYVSVTSHPNKEESEFYIIGLLGSLLFTLITTYLFVFAIYKLTGINIITEISNFLSSSKIKAFTIQIIGKI